MNLPQNINASIIYSDFNDKEYISSILNSFKILTNNIDKDFFNINYYDLNGLQKYSNIIDNQDLLIFLGYDIFLKSDQSLLNNFLTDNNHIILFPTKNDIYKNEYIFNVNDSLRIKSLYVNIYVSDNDNKNARNI